MADPTDARTNAIPKVDVDSKQPWSNLGAAVSVPKGFYEEGIETGTYDPDMRFEYLTMNPFTTDGGTPRGQFGGYHDDDLTYADRIPDSRGV